MVRLSIGRLPMGPSEGGHPPTDQPPPDAATARDYLAALPRDRFPQLTELADHVATDDADQRFELLLDRFVDGLAPPRPLNESRCACRDRVAGYAGPEEAGAMSDGGQTAEGVRQARGTSGQQPESGLARDLSRMAREMHAEPDRAALLRRVVDTALSEIDRAEWAGISAIHKQQLRTEAASDELVERIDELQYRLEEGPCLTSLRDTETVRSEDLATDDRWPRFAAAAAEQGVRSMLSVQLFVEGEDLGALNLYASEPRRFDDHDESVAMLLAAHAALAIRGHQIEAGLRTALVARDVIGQAKGILMERYKITNSQAFAMLVVVSQHANRKLRDVAQELATTGELQPTPPQPRPGPPRHRDRGAAGP